MMRNQTIPTIAFGALLLMESLSAVADEAEPRRHQRRNNPSTTLGGPARSSLPARAHCRRSMRSSSTICSMSFATVVTITTATSAARTARIPMET